MKNKVWCLCRTEIILIVMSLISDKAAYGELPREQAEKLIQMNIEWGNDFGFGNQRVEGNCCIDSEGNGNLAERKRILAELKSNNPARQYEAFVAAKKIGGCDVISALAELLHDTNGYRTLEISIHDATSRQDDVVFTPPRIEAANALFLLVPEPEVTNRNFAPPRSSEKDVVMWKKWWNANRHKYEAHFSAPDFRFAD